MSNVIEDFTTVDGVNVTNIDDQALFIRIGKLKTELKELNELGIQGAAMEAAVTDVKAKIDRLVAIVNARHANEAEGEG